MSATRESPGPFPSDGDRLFLPDFCGVRAVFAVVVGAQLLAFVFALVRAETRIDWTTLSLVSLLVQWIALASAALLCLVRPWLARLANVTAGFVSYAVLLLVTAVISEAAYWLGPSVEPGLYVTAAPHLGFVGRNLAIGAIVHAIVLRYLYVQHEWRRNIEAEAEARVQALQARIRPHFFFNSMNTIASLTRTRPALAEQAVENLADLFRATLGDGGKRVALTEELELVQRYLDIERLRLGERLHTEWAVDESLTGALVPLLIVQPLVENAVYHGVEPLAEGGTIRIEVGGGDGALMIAVTNPLPTSDSRRHREGNRMALANIRERLAYAYGRAAELGVSEAEGHYRVEIRLPFDGDARSDRR